jgi:ribonuclease R
LGQDYFQFDAAKHLLRGERSGARYQLGGRVRVKVVRVNLEQAKIDFVIVEQQKHAPASPWIPASAGMTKKPRDQDKRMTKIESRHNDGKRAKKR